MAFFTPRELRIEGECKVGIRLQECGRESCLPGDCSGYVINLSEKGACIVVSQMMLEGRHLFFSTLNSDFHQLVLTFDLAPGSFSPIVVTGSSVWMDSCTYKNRPAFKVGVEFNDRQKQLLKVFRKFN